MHLAIVTPFPPRLTGIGQYGYFVSKALVNSGAFKRISLITETAPPRGSEQIHDPLRSETWPNVELHRTWEPEQIDAGRQIVQRVKRVAPDLVWFNLGISTFGRSPLANLAGLASPAACQSAGIPTVVTLHEMATKIDLRRVEAPGGPFAAAGAELITRAYTHGDVVCVTLRRQMEWLKQHRPKVRTVYIPHGTFDRPESHPERSGLELLLFGMHSPFKGLELTLEAFDALRRRYPSLKLTIAGAEHPRFPGYLRQVMHRFQGIREVNWLGAISEQELAAAFHRASLVVLPYTATTGSSSVLYRAATWGRAIVASDLPELCEAASEGGLSIEYFRTGDLHSLFNTLSRMLANGDSRKRQAAHNLLAVERQTLAETCKAYLHAFDTAMEQRAVPSSVAFSSQRMNNWSNLK